MGKWRVTQHCVDTYLARVLACSERERDYATVRNAILRILQSETPIKHRRKGTWVEVGAAKIVVEEGVAVTSLAPWMRPNNKFEKRRKRDKSQPANDIREAAE